MATDALPKKAVLVTSRHYAGGRRSRPVKIAQFPAITIRRAQRPSAESAAQAAVTDIARDAILNTAASLRDSDYRFQGGEARQGSLLEFLATVLARSTTYLSCDRLPSRAHGSYPLRDSCVLILSPDGIIVTVSIPELSGKLDLSGTGTNRNAAMADLEINLDRVVRKYHFVPPHARTTEIDQADAILNHLIDWERFDAENPVEQPLWGRVDGLQGDGDIRVHWISGPNDEHDETSVLAAEFVEPALRGLHVGEWFYGAGRVFPDRLEWTTAPVRIPDPHDEQAIRAAWDLIPVVVMSDPNAWPLRRAE